MSKFHRITPAMLLLATCSSGKPIVYDAGEIEDLRVTVDVVVDGVIFPDLSLPDERDEPQFDVRDQRVPEAVGPACEPGAGCFLDPCTDNGDCQAGWCVDHMGEGVCSQTCQEECPTGWSCHQVAGSDPDVVFVCVSAYANLCRPCNQNADCTSVGGVADACLDYGPYGNFCGGPCDGEDSCPWGFSCVEQATVEGTLVKQCVNDAGECPCTDTSVILGLTTGCYVANEFGTCQGKRACTEEGLLPCDAVIPDAEACNGLDDDCDGEVDEPDLVQGGYVALCDDGNDCTDDACAGEQGCVNEVMDSGSCDDQNPCTVADHCETGACVGKLVDCDDGNPCTDDGCTQEGGCLTTPNEDVCDDEDPCTLADRCDNGTCVGTPIGCDCHEDADCAGYEDGDQCNGTLVCETGKLPFACVVDPDTVVQCPGPQGPSATCLAAACAAATGECSLVAAQDGALCSNGDQCTYSDICSSGECVAGQQLNCNDGNPCTQDGCDANTGCIHEPVVAPCTDGNPCTVDDHCDSGECAGEVQLDCGDGNPCTDDACDPAVGCVHSLNVEPCEDGDPCTQGDSCQMGICQAGQSLDCDDQNPCTDDVCQPGGKCGHLPNELDCLGGQCVAGSCIPDCQPDCDQKVCGSDGCGGTCGECNDDLECTADACSAGACVNSPKPFFCVVEGICVPSGTEAPGNPCRKCQPLSDQTAWTPQPDWTVCAPKHLCQAGECRCQPDDCDLLAKECGNWADGCGGELSCGDCDLFANSFCGGGSCACESQCQGLECGDNGCGGNCGPCAAGEGCIEGLCLAPSHVWSKGFAGGVFDWGQEVAVDSVGNAVVTGYFQSPVIDFGGGEIVNAGGGKKMDVFIAKFAPDGQHLWSKGLGNPEWDGGYAVEIGPADSVFVAGNFQSATLDFGNGHVVTNSKLGEYDMFVARFDSSGACQWAISLGGTKGDNLYGMDVDFEGSVVLSGYYQSVDFAPLGQPLPQSGGWEGFAARLDAVGAVQWVRSFNGENGVYGRVARFAPDGSVVVGGTFIGPSVEIMGETYDNSAEGEPDVYLVKLNAAGGKLWSKSYGAEGNESIDDLLVHADGRLTVAGASGSWAVDLGGGAQQNAGERNIYLARFDPDGAEAWSKLVGGPTYANANSLALDVEGGNVYVSGNFTQSAIDLGGGVLPFAGGYDHFVGRFASDGSHMWSATFGGNSAELRAVVDVAADGSLFLAGAFGSGLVSFGGPPVKGTGSYNIFIAKLAW